jgi:copper chaperone CopZ
MFIFATLLALLTVAQAEPSDAVRMDIEGMSCMSCEAKVQDALDALDFVSTSTASTIDQVACAELSGELDEQALRAAIAEVGYTVTQLDPVEACESSVAHSGPPRNWRDTDGLDVAIISWGETVDLEPHRAKGKFTIYDFGAPWCGPCHAAEALLKVYMADHTDVAVRAIVLDSPKPKTSFAMPVVAQHLSMVAGLPHFVVLDPRGKTIFRGSDVPRLLKRIDRRRK